MHFSIGINKMDKPIVTHKLENVDYILFTNVSEQIDTLCGWSVVFQPLLYNDPILSAKYYKWCAHNYDIAIYVDAYMSPNPNKNWFELAKQLSAEDVNNSMFIKPHPQRNCIYKECAVIVKCNKDTSDKMNKVIAFLKSKNMPNNYGLFETGIFIRHLKNVKFNMMCAELFSLIQQYTYRDQALLTYVFWKNNVNIPTYLTNDYYFITGEYGDHNYVINNEYIYKQIN